MQPGTHPRLKINADGGAEWCLQDRDALATRDPEDICDGTAHYSLFPVRTR